MRSNRRKLAAIMFTDIVGYTSLMGSDEKRAFQILKQSRLIHWRLIRKYKGRLLKEMGDGILASFQSATEATICALSLQKVTQELKIPLRIGIHLGDVIFEKKDVLGDGVNIASRIQSVAQTNGIVISETMYNNIRNKEELEFKFLGKKALKGVQSELGVYEVTCPDPGLLDVTIDTGELIAPIGLNFKTISYSILFIVLIMGLAYFTSPQWLGNSKKIGNSILVLPFDNFTGNDSLDYIVAGMHSSLIGELGRISGLRVISPHTSNTLKGTEKSLKEIAKELKVDVIIDASVICFGDSICFQPKLINVKDEENQLWAGNYTNAKNQVFNMYNQLARNITDEIHLALTPEEEVMLAEDRTIHPDAIELYLKGNFHLFQFTPNDVLIAQKYFNQALEIEKDFALAYAGLSEAGAYMLVLGMLPPAEAGQLMRNNALKCLAIDSLISESHYVLGQTYYAVDWEWEKGLKAFDRALLLNPNNAKYHIFYSHILTSLKRFEEAIEHGEKAVQLDPYNAFFHGLYGVVLSWAGKYEQATRQCEIGLEIDPLNPFTLIAYSFTLHESGKKEEGLEYLKKAMLLTGNTQIANDMDQGFVENGIKGAYYFSAQQMEKRWNSTYVKPHFIVQFYSKAGETEKVLDWLDTCYVYRDHDLIYAAVNPFPEEVRRHPRFIELIKKLKLPLD